MIIKTTRGEIREQPLGSALGGMKIESVTFTYEDTRRAFDNPDVATQWVLEILMLRLYPTKDS